MSKLVCNFVLHFQICLFIMLTVLDLKYKEGEPVEVRLSKCWPYKAILGVQPPSFFTTLNALPYGKHPQKPCTLHL